MFVTRTREPLSRSKNSSFDTLLERMITTMGWFAVPGCISHSSEEAFWLPRGPFPHGRLVKDTATSASAAAFRQLLRAPPKFQRLQVSQ